MPFRISRTAATIAAMAAGVIVGSSGARADLLVEFSTNGTTYQNATSAYTNDGVFAGATQYALSGPMSEGTISVLNSNISTNVPGTASAGFITASTFGVQNTSTTTAATIEVLVASSGFTLPSNPGYLSSGITILNSGTTASGGTATISACAFGNSGSSTSCPISGGIDTAAVTVTDPGNGSPAASNNAITSAGGLAVPFEIEEFVRITLNPGEAVQITSNSSVTVPEPASLALLGTGLLGLGMLRRRRRNGAALRPD